MIERSVFADGYSVSRLIKGGWHLAGGHGEIDRARASRDMALFVDAGITTFDCADIYTGVEELIGEFRRDYPAQARRLQVHTKFVPDLDRLANLDAGYIEAIIDRSLRRLRVEVLDLVQFHWWDYAVPRYVETALALDRLRRAGKIARLGVTNFDTPRLAEIIDAGVPLAAHQLQYSVLDDRPSQTMIAFCEAHDIRLLCYGTVAGGFLSERWRGVPEPAAPLPNRSLVKYKLIIDDVGGWAYLQRLLDVLADVAARHACDIATVATGYMLTRPGVAAAIVGATNSDHLAAHGRLADVILDDVDRSDIEAILALRAPPEGDVYALERDRAGRHGRIMKYNLSTG